MSAGVAAESCHVHMTCDAVINVTFHTFSSIYIVIYDEHFVLRITSMAAVLFLRIAHLTDIVWTPLIFQHELTIFPSAKNIFFNWSASPLCTKDIYFVAHQ